MSGYRIEEVMPDILERYRDRLEATLKPHLEINLIPEENLTQWQSKFAGWEKSPGSLPYLPRGFDYPQTSDGEYLHLLAQINFAEVPHLEGLPNRGILQFYLLANNDEAMYGLSNLSGEIHSLDSKWRVLYFSEPDLNEANLTHNFDFLPQKEGGDCEPFPENCSAIQWSLKYSVPALEDEIYEHFIHQPEAIEKDGRSAFIEAYDRFFDRFYSDFQMGGYSRFFSDDPRYGFSTPEDPFDTLLLKIPLAENGSLYFYIQSSAMARCDFSKVLYALA
ncbi:MAG: YwqG family protein [Cyanobacteriota bacterium]|nr:YwqG family protein [Cyanobacteriota bacterium]